MSDEIIIEMAKTGEFTTLEIAKEAGVSRQTVYKVMEKYGIDPPGAGRKLTVQDEAEILKDYREGLPVMAILTKYSIGYGRLSLILMEHNEPFRRGTKQEREAKVARAIQLYQSGIPVVAIVVETGISTTTLYKELYGRGIPRRRM